MADGFHVLLCPPGHGCYWKTRLLQQQKQQKSGIVDQGLRAAVTGGAQMDGFIELFARLIASTGLNYAL
jgi:hypothetical protein